LQPYGWATRSVKGAAGHGPTPTTAPLTDASAGLRQGSGRAPAGLRQGSGKAPARLRQGSGKAPARLGMHFARLFAHEGHDVVLVARRRDKLDRLATELSAPACPWGALIGDGTKDPDRAL